MWHMNVTYVTCKWYEFNSHMKHHIWMSHVTYKRHIWMWHMNVTYVTCKWYEFNSRMKHHIWMSHVTYECHVWMSHMSRVDKMNSNHIWNFIHEWNSFWCDIHFDVTFILTWVKHHSWMMWCDIRFDVSHVKTNVIHFDVTFIVTWHFHCDVTFWRESNIIHEPPKNGVIALWPDTRVVQCKYYVSQKLNGFNNKIHWYSILHTFVFKFTAKL